MFDNNEDQSILVVDDTPENIDVLSELLKQHYKVKAAINGEKAIKIAQSPTPPDLILLDVMMPEMDGYEVCRRLKSQKSTQHIPIIFVTAKNEEEDETFGFSCGAVDYITKPISPPIVLARVQTHLELRRTQRTLERELEIVEKLQRDLLPKRIPEIKGISTSVFYKTSMYAGGDYYDFVRISDHEMGILMADAEGHGAPAAVLMTVCCTAFRNRFQVAHDPTKILHALNNSLLKMFKTRIVTASYVIIDTETLKMKISLSGHMSPLLFRKNEGAAVELKCDRTFPLGFLQYEDIPITEFQLHADDILLFYTDGITERFNMENEMFGIENLLQSFSESINPELSQSLQIITDRVERFSQNRPADDDQSMLLCRIADTTHSG